MSDDNDARDGEFWEGPRGQLVFHLIIAAVSGGIAGLFVFLLGLKGTGT
jgi:hypothetical protein